MLRCRRIRSKEEGVGPALPRAPEEGDATKWTLRVHSALSFESLYFALDPLAQDHHLFLTEFFLLAAGGGIN
jgi:hypothetical protein